MPAEFFPLGVIAPNPFQSRETMDPDSIAELATNILATRQAAPETLGLLHTPRARRHGKGVQLAYGHRRLAAFRYLVSQGHSDYLKFPVELAELSDADMAIVAWSENTARADINPMEESRFVQRLVNEFGWTLNQAAAKLGIPRGTLSNIVRLTDLPVAVQKLIAAGDISRSRGRDLADLISKVSEAELCKLARAGTRQNLRTWKATLRQVHAETPMGIDLTDSVIEPAAQVLADALRSDEPGAWLIVARAIDIKANADGAADLARLVVDRAAGRARSTHDGKKRINALYEPAGLVPPWNAQATARVDEFVAWRKKHQKRERA